MKWRFNQVWCENEFPFSFAQNFAVTELLKTNVSDMVVPDAESVYPNEEFLEDTTNLSLGFQIPSVYISLIIGMLNLFEQIGIVTIC